MKKYFFLGAAALALISMTSCEGSLDDIIEEQANAPAPDLPEIPDFEDGDAVLMAIKSHSVQETPVGSIPVEINVAVAAFEGEDGAADVGAVTAEGQGLTQDDNNSYIFIPNEENYTGLSIEGDLDWTADGGNGFDGFETSVSADFPTVGDITSDTSISKAEDYTLTCSEIAASQQVIFLVGNVSKIAADGETFVTFTAEELSGLEVGETYIQVAPLNYETQEIGDKTVYFGRQTVRSQIATITE